MSESVLRLLIVDDRVLMRTALAKLLDAESRFDVVGEAGNCQDALELQQKLQPDLTLIDVALGNGSGIDCLREIKQAHSSSAVLMLSSSESDYHVIQAMESGADGYITKSADPDEFSHAIVAVAAGEKYISEATSKRLKDYSESPPLSQREIEVLRLVRRGMSNPRIGEELGITPRTAKAHVASILEKLGVKDRAEAVGHGFERGFLS